MAYFRRCCVRIVQARAKVAVASLSARFPATPVGPTRDAVPFDAVSVLGSAYIQFLSRDASKPSAPPRARGDGGEAEAEAEAAGTVSTGCETGPARLGEAWSVVSTTAYAEQILRAGQDGAMSTAERDAVMREDLTCELRRLLAPFYEGGEPPMPVPNTVDVRVKMWAAGFVDGNLDGWSRCGAMTVL